jgi:WS/DGAT/MGAT family acyltransferase
MRLTDHDASFLYGETASGPMHGGGVSVLEGEASYEELRAFIERRIHLVPRLRQRLVYVPMNLAHPKWVDDPQFNLDNHFKRHRVPDGTTVEQAIRIGIDLCEPLLDRTRPLWLTYVIEGVKGHTLMVQMAHHAMVDGVSGVDMSLVLTDLKPDASPPGPPNEKWAPAPLPTPLELWAEALGENAERATNQLVPRPRDAERERLMQRGYDTMRRFLTEPVIMAPWNAGVVGPKRKVEWTMYPFADFRAVRSAFGGTMNDVVLAVVSESAARYLKAHGETVDNQYLRLMCPVSVRREDERGELGNRVSGMYPLLPAWPMPIRDRLRAVCDETARLKANKEPQALELLMESAPATPPTAMAQTLLVGTPFDPTAFAARNPPPVPPRFGQRPPYFGFNFTCTNVPGVQMPQYVAGRKVLQVVGSMMLGGSLGYGVAVVSYNQQLYFNFTSDPRLMSDLELMRSGVDDAFRELLELARTTQKTAA